MIATTGGAVVCFESLALPDGAVCAVPRTRWSRGCAAPIFGSPAWLDGDAGGAARLCVVCANGLVLALLGASGVECWRVDLGAPVFSSPCCGAGVVVVGSHDKTVRCLRASDGSVAWRYAMSDVVYATSVWYPDAGRATVGLVVCSADGRIDLVSAAGRAVVQLAHLPGQVRRRRAQRGARESARDTQVRVCVWGIGFLYPVRRGRARDRRVP